MKHAGDGLRKIMADAVHRSEANQGSEETPVLAWPLVCGPAVAARTWAVAYRDGVLTVEAQDDTWRTQLAALAPTYVAALNQIVSERVRQVEFVPAATWYAAHKAAR